MVWLSPSGHGGFGNGKIHVCTGFPPPQVALHIILSNEVDAVYIDRYFFLSFFLYVLTSVEDIRWGSVYKCKGGLVE